MLSVEHAGFLAAPGATIGRLSSIVDRRILRGSGRHSVASTVVVRMLPMIRHRLPLQLMYSMKSIKPRFDPSVTLLPLLHHLSINPPAIVCTRSEKSQVPSCACSSWLLPEIPVNLTRCLHS